MGNHLHDHALHGLLVAGVDADDDEAHVADRGVGNQALDVGLSKGDHTRVDDADHTQPHRDRRERHAGLREERQGEAQHAEGRSLEQDASEIDRACGGRLAVGIRQPSVEGHNRHLHREGDEEGEHQPPSGFSGQAARGVEQIGVGKAPDARRFFVQKHQGEDGDQHHQAGGLSEQEELGGRIGAALAAGHGVTPERDEEEHRHQHHFPQEEEQEEVDRQEHADDTAQVPQQVEIEEADVAVDFTPGAGDGHQAQNVGQHHQQQGEAVHREMEVDAKAGDPRRFVFNGPDRRGTGLHQREVPGLPNPETHDHDDKHGAECDPARQRARYDFALPAEVAADEGDEEEPDENHVEFLFNGRQLRQAARQHPPRGQGCTSAGCRSGWQRVRRWRRASSSG